MEFDLNNFGDIGCTRASTVLSNDIVDVALTWSEGGQVGQGQLMKLQLAFTAIRNFSNLGVVVRIFDQSGRCAFANRYTDLDVGGIARSLSPGRHVVVVHFVATLPAGWYALTFSLGENPSGSFTDAGAWAVIAEQTCYAPFHVGDDSRDREEGYCRVPVNAYFALPDSPEPVVGCDDSIPDFPWPVDRPVYSVAQVITALNSIVPGLNFEFSEATDDFILTPGCRELQLAAFHPRFHTQVGQRTESGMVSMGEAGALLFGPYLSARPGRYVATFSGIYRGCGLPSVAVDVVASRGTVVLGRTELSCTDDSVTGTVRFVVSDPGVTDLEFRVFVGADVEVEICQVVVASSDEGDPLRAALREALAVLVSK